MKLSKLTEIVTKYANHLKYCAAYGGESHDGGSSILMRNLRECEHKIVVQLDLRPSERSKIYDVEVGEPEEFSKGIDWYKRELAKDIKL